MRGNKVQGQGKTELICAWDAEAVQLCIWKTIESRVEGMEVIDSCKVRREIYVDKKRKKLS